MRQYESLIPCCEGSEALNRWMGLWGADTAWTAADRLPELPSELPSLTDLERRYAEKEELFDNRDHAILAHKRALGPKKLVTIPDIKHYGVYREARKQAQKLAIEWYNEHLKK